MLKRSATSLLASFILPFILLTAVLCIPALAQDQPPPAPTDDEQAMRDQMRTMFQTIMQNMQDKGIDPQTFFQQLQNGADPSEIRKQLLDQGLIDQKTLDQFQSSILTIQSNSIKRQLGATDDEWKTLWPLIQKVLTASAALNGSRPGGGTGMAGFLATIPSDSDLAKATRALREAIKDPASAPERFAGVLSDYRAAKAQAQQQLDAARQDLTSALTVRQEGVLAEMGILE